jgi:DNA-binding transcriptional ArsR family regulator
MMPNFQILPNAPVLELLAQGQNIQKLEAVTKALGWETRLVILRYSTARICSLLEIAKALDLPPSTANAHINILDHAANL